MTQIEDETLGFIYQNSVTDGRRFGFGSMTMCHGLKNLGPEFDAEIQRLMRFVMQNDVK